MREISKIVYGHKPCSEEFQIAFLNQGSIAIDCEWCHRTHFNSLSNNFETGELDELQTNEEKDPSAYISHNTDVRYGLFMGRQIVQGCPCGFDGYWEDIVWNDRFRVRDYLLARRQQEVQALKKTCKAVDDIAKAVEGTKV